MQPALTIEIPIGGAEPVSGLLQRADHEGAVCMLAHGAGAGMQHAFMAAVADGLAARGIATLRYQFPFMQRGSRRVDPPPVAHAAVRAAVAACGERLPGLPLFAAGKSFGGRMSSQAQALQPLAGVRGLVFIGFPLHPAGKPSNTRAQHLDDVALPMLFLQGTRDALADAGLMAALAGHLGARATLRFFDDADHAFRVRASSGSNDAAVLEALLDAMADWIGGSIGHAAGIR